MATITLAANRNYSTLTVANGDTINLAGFTLTLDVVPSQTGVHVGSPGTEGKVVLGTSYNYPLIGWTFAAGTGTLIANIPAGKTFGGNITGGEATSAYGVSINNGIITGDIAGGSGSASYGVSLNYGDIVGDVTGGTGSGACGIYVSYKTITGDVFGGSANSASGVLVNEGTVLGNVTGGTFNAAYGVANNRSLVKGSVFGGSAPTAHGIANNLSVTIGALVDTVARAVDSYSSDIAFVNGPLCQNIFPASLTTIYALFGPLSPLATVSSGTEVIVLSGDTAAAMRLGNRLAQRGAYL